MLAGFAPQRGVLRAGRGAALAVANAVLAVAAHVAGGGAAPDGTLTVLAAVAIAAAGTALADRQRGAFGILAAVAVSQVMLHLLLVGLGHGHHAVAGPPGVNGAAMTAAHAAAALLTALLLAGAEAGLFGAWGATAVVSGVLRRIAGWLPPRRPPARLARPRPPAAQVSAPATALRRALLRATPHRGPPPLR